MTYNVFSGTLNPTQSINLAVQDCINWALLNPATEEMRLKAKVVADLQFTGDLTHETGPYRPDTDDTEPVSNIISSVFLFFI